MQLACATIHVSSVYKLVVSVMTVIVIHRESGKRRFKVKEPERSCREGSGELWRDVHPASAAPFAYMKLH